MSEIKRMKELVYELNQASDAYYNSSVIIMSDAEFDSKLEELKNLEKTTHIVLSNSPTHNVGATVLDNLKKVKHKTPMLSLDKCHSVEEVMKFSNNHSLVASVKLDGISCRLIYEDGELIRAESRGNGDEGTDITEAVKQFQNVPLHINKEGTYIIDGEALIKLDDFAEINKNGEYKNSRNLAAGTLSSLDTSVVKERRMRWYAWEVVEEPSGCNSFFDRLNEAWYLGFETVPFANLTIAEMPIDEAIEYFLDTAKEQNLPQDGVVFKFEDVKYGKSLGNTSHHFNNGIAYKVFNNSVKTELIDIEWTMGKTGVLTPVAKFLPVEIDGTIVERASLHNISVMREIMGRTWEGQKLGVYKSNLIIPQVRWAEQFNSNKYETVDDTILKVSYIHIPQTCPICGEPTQIVKENDSEVLMCTNPNCHGKLLGKLCHAVSRNALKIDGLSEATIAKFICLEWLNSIKDIYHLNTYEKRMKNLEGFGSKSVTKLLNSIEASRKTTLDRFLYSLSIPLVGQTASKAIAMAEDYDFESFYQDMSTHGAEFFRHIDGIGDTIINSLNTYFSKESEELLLLAEEFKFEQPEPIFKMTGVLKDLSGKTFVITGKLKHFSNRDEAKTRIEALGGKVSGSVTSKTSYLVNNDPNSSSSKNKKAKELNIPIISESELLSMVS